MELKGRTNAAARERGDTVRAVQVADHRVAVLAVAGSRKPRSGGFTLIELVMTMTVMSILAMGAVPLVKLAVKRQKEQQLRETLRAIRAAIDEFHRDTAGMPTGIGGNPGGGGGQPTMIDPRSRVVISDPTIFGVDNPDRYPPDLDTLVNGVDVISRGPPGGAGGAGLGRGNSDQSTLNQSQLATKKKVYLRAIPIDPITGKAEWDFRSCYDPPDSTSWGGENVFDVRSKSKETSLNGEKYSDW